MKETLKTNTLSCIDRQGYISQTTKKEHDPQKTVFPTRLLFSFQKAMDHSINSHPVQFFQHKCIQIPKKYWLLQDTKQLSSRDL